MFSHRLRFMIADKVPFNTCCHDARGSDAHCRSRRLQGAATGLRCGFIRLRSMMLRCCDAKQEP